MNSRKPPNNGIQDWIDIYNRKVSREIIHTLINILKKCDQLLLFLFIRMTLFLEVVVM